MWERVIEMKAFFRSMMLVVSAAWYTACGSSSGDVVDNGRYFLLESSSQVLEPSTEAGSLFGTSMAAGNLNNDGLDDIVVGAPHRSAVGENLYPGRGKVYGFINEESGFPAAPRWSLESENTLAGFGYAVAITDFYNREIPTVAGSMPFCNDGSMYWFEPTAWRDERTFSRSCSDDEGSSIGLSVSSGADVNGDGYNDLAIGLPTELPAGAVALRFGGETGEKIYDSPCLDESEYCWWFGYPAEEDNFYFGNSTILAHTNGDRYADIIVSAPGMGVGIGMEDMYEGVGSFFLFLGNSPWPEEYGMMVEDPFDQGGDLFGQALAAGRITGDVLDDIVAGALGRVHVYAGSPEGFSLASTLHPPDVESSFGTSVATGDINADGYDELIIGAPRWNDEGRVYVYYNDRGVLQPDAAWVSPALGQRGSQLGLEIITADLNADGRKDLLAAEPWWDGEVENEGRVHIFYSLPGVGMDAGSRSQDAALVRRDAGIDQHVVDVSFDSWNETDATNIQDGISRIDGPAADMYHLDAGVTFLPPDGPAAMDISPADTNYGKNDLESQSNSGCSCSNLNPPSSPQPFLLLSPLVYSWRAGRKKRKKNL